MSQQYQKQKKKWKEQGKIEEIKRTLKLNHPCKICKMVIYIGDSVIYQTEPYHIECLLLKIKEQGKSEVIERIIEDLIVSRNKYGLDWCDSLFIKHIRKMKEIEK